MRSRAALYSLALVWGAAGAAGAAAETDAVLRVVVAARRGPASERIEIARGLVPTLLRAASDRPLYLADWPLAPGARARVELRRFDIYSPEARLLHAEGDRKIEVGRSRLLFFEGRSRSDTAVRVLVWLDPVSRRLGGFADSRAGRHHLLSDDRRGRWYRITREPEPPAARGAAAGWSCGTEPGAEELEEILSAAAAARTAAAAPAITTLHFADIAVDTDTEFMALKFADNTTAAANYIAQLLASMSVMYERDLKVRLRQGFTVLRTTAAGDPYSQLPDALTGSATFAQLNEFTNYWKSNYAGQARTVAMLLSGKSPVLGLASGIAWVDGLCSKDVGYSFIQVFRFAGSSAASDSKLVGHELGHNFGSLHSHCYELDDCEKCEACGADVLLSCPAAQTMNGVPGVNGTVMSYCHSPPTPCTVGGCSSSEVFHSTTVANVLNPKVQDAATAPNQCIFPLTSPTKFFTVTPCRLLDTQNTGAPLGGPAVPASSERFFTIPSNACGIPPGALTLAVNFTVPTPASAGFFSAYPGDIGFPGTTIQYFGAGRTRSNNGVLKVGPGLTFKVFNGSGSPLHLIVDVTGYFAVSP